MTSVRGPGLYEFLIEAELQQYYAGIKNDLKVQNVPQLKYVTEDDLHTIGMSKPEMRRLKKFFQKHFPQNYLSKFKKILLRKEEQVSTFPTLPDELIDKPPIKVPNKHIIPAEAIIVNKELGTGEFGVVQQGVWTNDGERIQVAIKCLSRERMQNNPIEFLKEAAIMHAIDHEHIVRLYGVVLDTNALMLVTELAPLRSLLECLKEPSLRASFPILSLCDFAIQICDGMQYLEMKRLIHRDLAARNILVFSKNKVKISDFGLSRALGVGKDYYQTNFNVNLKLPIAWCAPECISYLRFTSASDVWAYGVTLWEMFSYGFQPWAALTGHQILEAIDEPNFQRLEQPECCPKEYFSVMLKCWQHDPNKRPRFADLINILPECKPEQVQAVQEYGDDPKVKQREQLMYRVGDVITVLDKGPFPNVSNFWKGILNNGKTGLFNPAYTVAYLGSNLPSNKTEFIRGDGKNAYSSRRRLRPDMISSPQGDFKHTSHVGLDGAYFGDISFLGGKYHHLPRQVVTPYKPQEDSEQLALGRSVSDASSDRAPLLTGTEPTKLTLPSDAAWSDTASESSVSQTATGGGKGGGPKFLLDHEYHEISDEEGAVESPRFEKSFDFGPSLLDEMDAVFRSFGGSEAPPPPPSPGLPPPPASPLDETINVRNELREMAAKVTGKKKQATVKPISAADQRTLDCAIAMANELTARSMNDLDNGTPPESPHTPGTPGKRKFSFRFPSTGTNKHTSPRQDRKTFSEEAASIPDIQSSLSAEAKEVYSSLVEQPVPAPSLHANSPPLDTNPLRMLRSGAFPVVRPRVRGNKHNGNQPQQHSSTLQHQHSDAQPATNSSSRSLPRIRVPPPPSTAPPPIPSTAPGSFISAPIPLSRNLSAKVASSDTATVEDGRTNTGQSPSTTTPKNHQNATRESSVSSDVSEDNGINGVDNGEDEGETVEGNPIPLPPRDRSRPLPPTKPRHQRKHPLIIPGGGVTRTLAKMAETEIEGTPVEETTPQYLGLQTESESLPEPIEEVVPDQGKSPIRNISLDDSFEQRIACELAALDDIPGDTGCGPGGEMVRHSDHVSCEDLLEFACDTPNARRTQGKARGVDSDEVRIMGKVLGTEVSAECCVSALNISNWDVHRAIKLARLHNLLQATADNVDVNIDFAACNEALETCSWDVARAASWVLAQEQGDTTQV
ncbi:activated Cdc42 kinase-like isoform X2 [Periplaneta americana]|uniref:activated Cdc42 kinase-like isoform X2 n=1 Tax=Periplaneta americana TaxID=6978 RepID=UPI0037E6F94C